MTDTTESAAPAQASLSDLRMPELQALATRLGISGISKMRKPELVEAIRERRRANGQRPRTEAAAPAAAPRTAAQESGTPEQAPRQQDQSDKRQQDQGEKRQQDQGDKRQQDQGDKRQQGRSRQQGEGRQRARGQQQRDGGESRGEQQEGRQQESGDKDADQKMASLDDIIHFPEPADRGPQESTRGNRRGRQQSAAEQQNEANDDDGDGDDDRPGRRRRGRDRYRDRKRRQTTREGGAPEDEVEILEDDVLIPVAGILDVLENYAFVRTSGYLPGPSDVYVSLGQVKKAGLRRGDAIAGAVRQPREGENQRQKFNALVRLDAVNGGPVEDATARPEFAELTPIHPDERLRLETGARALTGRIIDLVSPIGKGQRSVVAAPRGSGSTATLQQIATAVTTNHPEVHLMVVLLDARPEEVTDWQRTAAGEVVASTFDRPAADHTTVAELAIERAKRLVELGQDVVVVLDSVTALGRGYNLAIAPSGRMLPGGVDAAALHPTKRFVGSARNIENGGSLTIISSEIVDTGSPIDEILSAELAGTASSELRLRRELADKRLFPAVDPTTSGTQYLDRLLTAEEVSVLEKLHRSLSDLAPLAALELLLTRVQQSGSNAELLLAVSRES